MSVASRGDAAAAQSGAAQRNPGVILTVAAFAAFLATFNETFLNVGFAPIMASLSVDVSTVQWLATAYMLGAAVMVPISAFAYRSFRTRPLFCVTVALLVLGSVIGGLAPNFPVLLTGRIVQALGTGMLVSGSLVGLAAVIGFGLALWIRRAAAVQPLASEVSTTTTSRKPPCFKAIAWWASSTARTLPATPCATSSSIPLTSGRKRTPKRFL